MWDDERLNMEQHLEESMKKALKPSLKADIFLNQKIRDKIKENETMENRRIRKMSWVALVAALVLMLSVTAYAAFKFLSSRQVVEKMERALLAKAFENENGIEINETVTAGGLEISLLGIASGESLDEFSSYANGVLLDDRTYAVIGVSYEDGRPMPNTSEDAFYELELFMSPLIKGLEPWNYNIMSMHGGYMETVIDGVWYRLIECDNIEIFADRGLYLFVTSESSAHSGGGYDYNEKTGEIMVREDFKGISILFDLPIDPNKGNPEKAEAYLKALEEEWTGPQDLSEELHEEGLEPELRTDVENVEEFIKDMVLMEDSVMVLTPDEEGMIHYEYQSPKGSGYMHARVRDLFKFGHTDKLSDIAWTFYGEDEKTVETVLVFERDADGVIKGMLYHVR